MLKFHLTIIYSTSLLLLHPIKLINNHEFISLNQPLNFLIPNLSYLFQIIHHLIIQSYFLINQYSYYILKVPIPTVTIMYLTLNRMI